MKHSVVIASYNRAEGLRETLGSLREMSTGSLWELIVVDNNSTDHTRDVVEEMAADFPVLLRYVFEPTQGRSAALNTGFRSAEGDVILTTDDDVRVARDWLDEAVAALRRFDCAYVGGRVLPIWDGKRPAWLPDGSGRHWVPIALFDLGPNAVEFTTRAPLGVNMAVRREVFARAGYFDNELGRKAGTLLGQEVREWCLRVRAAGMAGYYVPEMVVHHKVPSYRLKKSYFRRSFYWRGVSRAILYRLAGADMETPERPSVDPSRVRYIAGVPRYIYRKCANAGLELLRSLVRRDSHAILDHEMQLWFYIGIVVGTWKGFRGRSSERVVHQRAV